MHVRCNPRAGVLAFQSEMQLQKTSLRMSQLPCILPKQSLLSNALRSAGVVSRDGRPGARRHVCKAGKATADALAGLRIMEWTGEPHQVQALDEVRQRMAESPYSEQVDDEMMRWFLLDRKLIVEDTVEKLIKMLRWRREFGADSLKTTDVATEAATGKAYLHTKFDIQNRPVLIVRASKHVNGAAPLVESQRLCVFLLDRAMENIPEDQETILGIFDLRGFTSKNTDLGFVRFMVDVFFTYYPKRLSQVLFVDAPWIFMGGWNVFRPWLKKYQALVRFVSAEEVRKDYFTSETVPEDFASKGFPPKK